MNLRLSRDSVAAGDDVDSHDQLLTIESEQTVAAVLGSVARGNYLAWISGGRATWVATAGRHGRPLAVVAQEWESPRFVVDPNTEIGAIGGAVHFQYLAQRDPHAALEEHLMHKRRNT